MEAQTHSLGSTQPVPSFVSSKSARSQTLSRSDVCAKFVTTTTDGRAEEITLSIGKPITIGRNPSLCSYVIPDIVVSSLHCKIHAVQSSTGGIIVSCQDLSTNGLILNGHKIRKASVIVMNGDTFRIPASQTFQCILKWKHLHEKYASQPSQSQTQSYKDLGRFLITSHCLGSGSYATVQLALDTTGHQQAACKIIRRKEGNDQRKEMKEATLLMNLHHPNINRVYAVDLDPEFLYIMLELCTGGDLFTYITTHSKHRLCEGEAKYIMYQLLKGLKYLHDRMISHRDLKPENILLFSPGPYPRIQIADFGLARPKAYQETLHVCGTISYLPPEGILALEHKHLGYVGMPADCWSAGVTLFAMLTGSHPFDFASSSQSRVSLDDIVDSQGFVLSQHVTSQDERTKQRILDGKICFHEPIWGPLRDAKILVSHLLVSDPRDRATVYAALKSWWICMDLEELDQAYRERIRVHFT
ncbi:kinase-like protein [Suillus clintonianus]|uniref:kinase-like protein n=1 Tax=Suillus clintonianus TaxID=1904413 RepID=UPI001B87D51B|nr:kinase-like protein [Suillus clintonianus]KAG2154650.1 kinase-like protein [Suillus clintonianus]